MSTAIKQREELAAFIKRMGIMKTRLADSLGVRRDQIYAYLKPEKYPNVIFTEDERRRIEEYVQNVVRKIA